MNLECVDGDTKPCSLTQHCQLYQLTDTVKQFRKALAGRDEKYSL